MDIIEQCESEDGVFRTTTPKERILNEGDPAIVLVTPTEGNIHHVYNPSDTSFAAFIDVILPPYRVLPSGSYEIDYFEIIGENLVKQIPEPSTFVTKPV